MTDPHRLAAAIEEAKSALAARARTAGVADPEGFAHEFVMALRHQGWRPFAPSTALPPVGRWVPAPHELIEQTRAHLRANRPTDPNTSEGETDG